MLERIPRSGETIVTSDGIICLFDEMIDERTFRAVVCNNIGDHLCVNSVHRIEWYRLATNEEFHRLQALCRMNNLNIL